MGIFGSDNDAARDASKIANKYYRQTMPARTNILHRGTDFLRGDFDPAASPVWDPTKTILEDQYNRARENVIANMPVGGPMQGALGDIETNRANQLASLGADIATDEYNKIYGAAMGAPQVSLGGLTSIAGTQAAAQAQQAGAGFGAIGDIGGGLGMMLGMKGQGKGIK